MAKKQNPFTGIKPAKLAKTLKPVTENKPAANTALRNVEYTPTVTVSNEMRAGFTDYKRELQERLQDIEESGDNKLYTIHVRLTPSAYQHVLRTALKVSHEANWADWTEQDQLEAWIGYEIARADGEG